MTNRNITAEDLANQRRLRAIWDREKAARGFTQTSAAKATGFGHQATVAQYLNGTIALNTNAILSFAEFLRCSPADIAPALGERLQCSTATHRVVDVPVVATLSGGPVSPSPDGSPRTVPYLTR
jgi:hypothetical protein